MLIDTHTHLDAAEFDADREAMLARARQSGVGRFVLPAVSAASFPEVAALAAAHPDIHRAYGIHPLYVGESRDEDLELLDQRLAEPGVVAVGEIGLDHYVEDIDPGLQEHYFAAQLRLARQHGLPVILHVRRAQDAILKQLRRIEVPGGIAHAFNGSLQQADVFISLGFKLGFGGAMTYDGSKRIRRLAAELPLDALVLETDAPDIPPAWARGTRNEPGNLPRYAEILAELRGVPMEEIVLATTRNACTALPRLASA
ncbi:TatD family deoxyribonuclease [Azoarcus indigens]|uniref:TatD DNase family protein n=1 Tax=Azoarcus indigens TaxID=29545 RepID=A0A4R6EC10_9RHOO|nr:TatD family hydrolase [Azoarcus indigens]NMG64084.1 TatD family deoxyribonuclease [Azoarcus indigens]TDN55680.1 TatD DNase family protein [Azoarcus indigens]